MDKKWDTSFTPSDTDWTSEPIAPPPETHVAQVPVHTFRERMICECGGEMKGHGTVMLSSPAQQVHACEQCGRSKTICEPFYPRIVHVDASP